ncbi:GAF and ANTAR domain-containing protein [Rhodococcoides kyotonense]|uniref:GAF and ANTAR domain-containing protein n=1 Tax=Rhodococcoides kyotonense TaxID=398843 RepID=UPI0015954E4E|nr:GAF and ANTAR domain-containing protein [Rhodococcus kyotonensis]
MTVAEEAPEDGVIFRELSSALTAAFDIVGASVLIPRDDDSLEVASVPTELAAIEKCQAEFQRGPGCDAYRGAQIVAVADIARAHQRWPRFVDVAVRAGIVGVAAFPLFRGGDAMGSLVLYSTAPQAWSATDLDAARVLARLATAQLFQSDRLRKMKQLSEQLEHALESRIVIEQAKGVLAATDNVDTEAAFERIRQHARRHRTSVREVARAVVEHRVRL